MRHVRFNDLDRAPPPLAWGDEKLEKYHKAIASVHSAINDERNQISLQLSPDKILLTDNWRVMHGLILPIIN